MNILCLCCFVCERKKSPHIKYLFDVIAWLTCQITSVVMNVKIALILMYHTPHVHISRTSKKITNLCFLSEDGINDKAIQKKCRTIFLERKRKSNFYFLFRLIYNIPKSHTPPCPPPFNPAKKENKEAVHKVQ